MSSNSKNTTISSANKQKVLTEPLIHELKPFLFQNTYLIATSQANQANFEKMMATKWSSSKTTEQSDIKGNDELQLEKYEHLFNRKCWLKH